MAKPKTRAVKAYEVRDINGIYQSTYHTERKYAWEEKRKWDYLIDANFKTIPVEIRECMRGGK